MERLSAEEQQLQKDLFDGKWTSSDNGRAAFGGWSVDAWKQYEAFKDKVDQRYKENSKEIIALQEAMLQKLEEKHGQAKPSANKKRKKNPAEETESEDEPMVMSDFEGDSDDDANAE